MSLPFVLIWKPSDLALVHCQRSSSDKSRDRRPEDMHSRSMARAVHGGTRDWDETRRIVAVALKKVLVQSQVLGHR